MSLIITLTGMSTSGKSTLAKAMSSREGFKEAVSVTTRPMRPGEIHGVDYYFVNDDEFNKYVAEGVLLEHVRSHHAAYGVPAFEVENILAEGKSPVIVLEPIGVQAMYQVAKDKGYNFMSGFVCTDMLTIFHRFFNRIDKQLSLNKPVDYLGEAKRLHTILTIERSWSWAWPWDKLMTDLHQGDNLIKQVNELESLHYGERQIQSKANCRLNNEVTIPECMDPHQLSIHIADVAQGNSSLNSFLRKMTQRSNKAETCFELK
ncbi:guanylate kinase (plasmid) [Pseudomonas sp. FeN3W]|nr:guanylate kinase [Pseudomonas sp. FeN3W]